jgi:serine phosphatase RsbU (regulator of sigma subunit)
LTLRVFKTRRPGDDADARYSTSIVRRCLDKGEGILGNDLAQQFPDSESLSGLPLRSLMCAPLWSPEAKPLGAIQLDAFGPKPMFTQDDLKLLLGVASQASLALSNARLHRDALRLQNRERDEEVGKHVQRALLPQHLPDIPGYQFFAHYESALKVGGDYYDFLPLPGQRWAILLGDVAGKGVPAALIMAKFSVEARVCLETEADLAAAVSKLNDVLARSALQDRFVTLVALVLDPAAHTAALVNAGHLSPLLVRRASGEVEEATPLAVSGLPLGVTAGHPFASSMVQLLPGDALYLFSDGIPDALNAQGHDFGTKGILAVLQSGNPSPREMGERLIQAVKRHALGCEQNDDITLVCFGRVGS